MTAADVFLDDGLVIAFETGEIAVLPHQIRPAPQPEVVFGSGGGIMSREFAFG